MTISEAMDNLVEEVRAIGLGEYFDGLDYEDIIENALEAYRRDIISRADEIKEDMYPDGIDSESDEPKKKTRDEMLAESEDNYKCPECGADCSAVTCPADDSFLSPLDDLDEWGNDLIEETDYLEEDDEE